MKETFITGYIDFISENLEECEELRTEFVHWQQAYNQRVFNSSFSNTINDIMKQIKQQIKENMEQCVYYIKRIEEMNNAKANKTQS